MARQSEFATDSERLAIRVRNARVVLGGRVALDIPEWDLPAGGHAFVLGPNGSGKSTFAKLLLGHVWPIHGASVEVLGETLGRCDLRELRRRLAWVSPHLAERIPPSAPAWEVAASGIDASFGLFRELSDVEAEATAEALRAAGCGDFLWQEFGTLSSGQRMRALVARAMASKPDILLLDEPFEHLDIAARERLMRTIVRLAGAPRPSSILLATQRVEEVHPLFTRGLLLRDGRAIARGGRASVLAEAPLSEAFGLPLELVERGGRVWALAKDASGCETG